MVGRLRRLCGGLVAEAMCWVGCGGYVLGGLRRKIVPTLAQPTGFSNRSECGKNGNPIDAMINVLKAKLSSMKLQTFYPTCSCK